MINTTKTALVTGGARGIGAGICRALANEGWRVYVNYNQSARQAEALAVEIGGTAIQANISNESALELMFGQIGEIGLLVNNAGVAHYGLFTDMDTAAWRKVFTINVEGAATCCRLALQGMIKRGEGCIINISSVWGVHGASCEAAYSASKAALIGLTKALAKEAGPAGIRVNCVAPGAIDTDMLAGLTQPEREDIISRTPLSRLGLPGDIGAAVAFLASDKASFITGQVLGVDGGFY